MTYREFWKTQCHDACGACRFFRESIDQIRMDGFAMGYCVRRAPQREGFPVTREDQYCGEFTDIR